MTKTYKNDALAAIYETASGLHDVGLLDEKTMRRFDENCLTPTEKLPPEQIKAFGKKPAHRRSG